jgi:hypothetical protein
VGIQAARKGWLTKAEIVTDISGNVTKNMSLIVESSKNEAGERTYRIAT